MKHQILNRETIRLFYEKIKIRGNPGNGMPLKGPGGFTLLEIVIVLTIIGFLLAMIAPRLGSVSTEAVNTLDDGNIKALSGYVVLYQQEKNRLPNKPVTIVNTSSGGDYQLPLVDDGDADNGPETIGESFYDRCRLRLHILSEEEAEELKKLGIRRVVVLNDYVGSTNEKHTKDGEDSDLKPQTFASGDDGRAMHIVEVEEGLGVLMVAAGADGKDGKITADLEDGDKMGNPEWTYRIVLGLGADSSLVSEGMVQNEGLSPTGMRNADYNTFNNYSMLLPRLGSTLDRIGSGEPKTIKIGDSEYDENDEQAMQKEINLGEEQELWQVQVLNPLGYKWPQDKVDLWEVLEMEDQF